jgi:hypothetical protein
MAYLEFAECGGARAAIAATPATAAYEAARPAARFSALEWWVVAAAQRDRLSSLEAPGPVARLLGSLFPSNDNGRGADPRIEALRRMAVLAWHKSYVIPKWEIEGFRRAGFTLDHYELLQASIAAAKAKQRSARVGRPGHAARRAWIPLEPAHGLS